MYQLGTIIIPSGATSLKVTFNSSSIDSNTYPDLVLISPTNVLYDYGNFDSVVGETYQVDDRGNFYTGSQINPEVMEIFNPEAGTWKVGAYPSNYDGDIGYTLEANYNIIKYASEK